MTGPGSDRRAGTDDSKRFEDIKTSPSGVKKAGARMFRRKKRGADGSAEFL